MQSGPLSKLFRNNSQKFLYSLSKNLVSIEIMTEVLKLSEIALLAFLLRFFLFCVSLRRASSSSARSALSFLGTRTPVFSCTISSRFSGISVVMTGNPLAIASMMALLMPSPSVGRMKISDILRISLTSFRFPRKLIAGFDR